MPDDPDLVILIAAANRVITDRLMAAMAEAGLTMRPAWGYVIRALYAEPLPLARLAELLDVTKQAAQQTVDDMEAAGLLAAQRRPGRRAPQAARADRRGPPRAGHRAGRQRRARGRDRTTGRAARRVARDDRAPRRPRARARQALTRRVVKRARASSAGRRARPGRRRSRRRRSSRAPGRGWPAVTSASTSGITARAWTRLVCSVQPRVYISSSGSGVAARSRSRRSCTCRRAPSSAARRAGPRGRPRHRR